MTIVTAIKRCFASAHATLVEVHARLYVQYLRLMFRHIGKHAVIYPPIYFKYPHKIVIGDDCIIRRGVTLNGRTNRDVGIALGTGVAIRENSYVDAYGGCIELSDYCSVGHQCIIGGHGGLHVGKYTIIGGMTYIIPSNHIIDSLRLPFALQGERSRGIVIGSNVWIAAGCRILDGIRIGDNSVIGAGAVVTKSLPGNVVAFGVPATVRRPRIGEYEKGSAC